ncbi:hypothetical protein HanRHA438_Chr08g0343351 [Helianthus annuus]|nr:hypothetical protein HanRHA438_Chr08g0343351 [Helianthus annuus]
MVAAIRLWWPSGDCHVVIVADGWLWCGGGAGRWLCRLGGSRAANKPNVW